MKTSIRIATVCPETNSCATVDNLAAIEHWTQQAVAAGAELILFPELSLCGFIPNHPVGDHAAWLREAMLTARRVAEPLDGKAVTQLIEIARSHRVMIAAGLFEDAGNLLYNTAVLVDGNGLIGRWRKMHVPAFEMQFYSGGGEPEVVETPLGRIGVNICFDAFLPESTRLLAVQNVELVLFPFAADPPPGTPEAWVRWGTLPVTARCIENGVFGVACNYEGRVECAGVEQEFPGGAFIIGPRGEQILYGVSSRLNVASLQSSTLLEARADPDYLFRFRRPELYGRLAR